MEVSILMPVYNTRSFLEKCLYSIVNQSLTNWELIAIDDHSTDGSDLILKQFAQQDSRIKTFPNPGKGIIHALRSALEKSSGKYITRMDSDDIMATNKLELLHLELQQKGRGYLSCGHVAYFSENTLGEGYKKYAQWLNSLITNQNHYQEIYRECVIPSPCWMIHREDLDQCGAFKPNTYPEDYDLCFRFYQHKIKIASTNGLLHYWRDHGERASRNKPEYTDNAFIPLKVDYFSKLDYSPDRPLVLWGAGKKGKRIASLLMEKHIPIEWVCNTPGKWGKIIHNTTLKPTEYLANLNDPFIIIAVAGPEDQKAIKKKLAEYKRVVTKDYFFFC